MRTAWALRHVAFEDLGTLESALVEAGFEVVTIDVCTTDLSRLDALQPDLLVVLGGPIGVYEAAAYPFLGTEIDMLRTRLAGKRATLGICLGAQLLAAALGARVHPGTHGKELGWEPLIPGPHADRHPWFAALLSHELPVMHWHGDTFELPMQAEHLAATPRYAQQAYAIGRHALGLQFHPEVRWATLERWYVGHASELTQAGIDIVRLRQEGLSHGPSLEEAAGRFWRAWLGYAFESARSLGASPATRSP